MYTKLIAVPDLSTRLEVEAQRFYSEIKAKRVLKCAYMSDKDRRLMAYTDFGIGLTSPLPQLNSFLEHLNTNIGELSNKIMLDAGHYLGVATAFFSKKFRQVISVEGDSLVAAEARELVKRLAEKDLAELDRIEWKNANYLSVEVPFQGIDILYNYYDHAGVPEKETIFLHNLSAKFINEAPCGALLVILNSDLCRKKIHMLRHSPALSYRIGKYNFNVFQKD
ncbi:MAG: hypothetical protein AAB649_01045 [Patescibacteria group bacterium]